MTTTVQHLATRINGRDYYIEVTNVDVRTWRAQVVTEYGGRTALMPFYGASAEDATERLAEWLRRASRPPAPAAS
ncbi:MAG: hypothetical protein U0Q12_18950 [Vicinamibacterales bacterium]